MNTQALKPCLSNIELAFKAGNATEHTHRPALKSLVQEIAPGVTATNEPRRIKCGAPDYIITRGTSFAKTTADETKGFSRRPSPQGDAKYSTPSSTPQEEIK